MNEYRLRFLRDEIWFGSWRAAVGRASFYEPSHEKKETKKKALKSDVKNFLKHKLDSHYGQICTEEIHLKNISDLVDLFNAHDIVRKDRYGSAQKLLNVYLKYLWCFQLINCPPPHCPVDRIIIAKISLPNTVNWTQLKNLDGYMQVIEAIRLEAKECGLTIFEWELKHYSPWPEPT